MNKKKKEIRGRDTEEKIITNKNRKLRRWNCYE
jgi:hypothetical protein